MASPRRSRWPGPGAASSSSRRRRGPGERSRSEELTLPGFVHDTFSAVHPAGAASPVFARMGLERHGLRWVHPQACYAHPLPDGRAGALYRDLDRTAASLDALAPGDGARWRAFAEPYVRNFDALRATLLGAFPPLPGALRLAGALRWRGTLQFARLGLMPAQALGEELFQSAGSRAWLYGSALHSDVPPSASGSAIAAVYLNLLGHGWGWPSPQGGAGRLAAALVASLQELGGAVRTRAEACAIEARDGRTAGVVIEGGERLAAPIVIADVMPSALARLAGELLPAPLRGRPAPLPDRTCDRQGRLGACRPDCVDRPSGAPGRHRARRRRRARAARCRRSGRCR